MIWLLAAHALVGGAILIGAPRLGHGAFRLGALPMLATLAYVAAHARRITDGDAVVESTGWVGRLDLSIDLRLDGFGLLMVLIISGIGVAVMAYSTSYFAPTRASAHIAGLLVLFSGSMVGLVMADHLLVLYMCWELTSITSWLLIGSDHTDSSARAGALHALMVTGAGGLVLLGGLVVIGQQAGTYSLSEVLAAPPTGGAVGIGLACILVGVFTKSAQFPTHAWLPGAMVAPTPISAYLHSATMVKAGIYLAARFAPAFAVTGSWRAAVTIVGLMTMIHGGVRALRQHDLKLLLAMGTISQLGFLLVLVGTGRPEATLAGCLLLVAHALFKAPLFFIVGIIDHQTGTRDRRLLQGFGSGWTAVKVITAVSAASMAGIPPLVGFVAKEGAYETFIGQGVWGAVTLAGLVAGSVLTVAYSVRFAITVLAPATDAAPTGDRKVQPPSVAFVLPAAVLALFTVVAGVGVGGIAEPIVGPAAQALDARITSPHLALWHGVNLALLLSLVTLTAGAVLVAARRTIESLQDRLALTIGGDEAFTAVMRGLNLVARRLTGVVQNGSLPVYIAVILLTAIVMPSVALARSGMWAGWPRFAEAPIQGVVAALIIGAALAAVTATRRFAAVLLLGGVGYGMAMVYVVQGAPDLALTQFAVETLSLLVFALVLRRLPDRFERRSPAMGRWLRVAVAGTIAAGVFAFALISAGSRTQEPISGGLVERSLPEGGGRNVVNVILVDFRGLDTLGEISVLVAAGVGVVALARVRRDRESTGLTATGATDATEPSAGEDPP